MSASPCKGCVEAVNVKIVVIQAAVETAASTPVVVASAPVAVITYHGQKAGWCMTCGGLIGLLCRSEAKNQS